MIIALVFVGLAALVGLGDATAPATPHAGYYTYDEPGMARSYDDREGYVGERHYRKHRHHKKRKAVKKAEAPVAAPAPVVVESDKNPCGEAAYAPVKESAVKQIRVSAADGDKPASKRKWEKYAFDVQLCRDGKPVNGGFKPAYGVELNGSHYLVPGGSYGTSGLDYTVQSGLGVRKVAGTDDTQAMILIDMSWSKLGGEGLPSNPGLKAHSNCQYLQMEKNGVSCDEGMKSVDIAPRDKPYELADTYVIPVKIEWPDKGFPEDCMARIKKSCLAKSEKK
jgi:hypothetical protein